MLLIRKTVVSGCERIVLVKASRLQIHCQLDSPDFSCCVQYVPGINDRAALGGFSGMLITEESAQLRTGWNSGNLVHTSRIMTPPLPYCGLARRESLPSRQAGGYEYNLDLWFLHRFRS